MSVQACIYDGWVEHQRSGAHGDHRFRQRLAWFLINLDELPQLDRLRVMRINRAGLWSFHDADHVLSGSGSWSDALRRLMVLHHIDGVTRFQAVCLPRLFGFVFNPISLVFCLDKHGTRRATVYEVRNTFGETHSYVVPGADEHLPVSKTMHVSPFFSMSGQYHFFSSETAERFSFGIRYEDENGSQLHATFRGERRLLTDQTLLRLALRWPWQTVAVKTGILWQALRLWVKRVPLYKWTPSGSVEVDKKARRPGFLMSPPGGNGGYNK